MTEAERKLLEEAQRTGVKVVMELLSGDTSGALDALADSGVQLVKHAIDAGIKAGIEAARMAEIKMHHEGDATGELKV